MTKDDIHKLNQKLLMLQNNWITKSGKCEGIYFSEVKRCFRYFVLYYCKRKGIRKTNDQIEEIVQDCFVKILVWYKTHTIHKNPLTVYRHIVFNRLFAVKGRIARMEREQKNELSLDDVLECEKCV